MRGRRDSGSNEASRPVPDRRTFLKTALAIGAGGMASFDPRNLGAVESLLHAIAPDATAADLPSELLRDAPRARYWTADPDGSNCLGCHFSPGRSTLDSPYHTSAVIQCQLCAQQCLLSDGDRGHCKARINVDGELRSLVYGRPISAHVDPIEKGPFYHFLPGSKSLCLATAGCPLSCKFCQNWELSQALPEDREAPFTTAERVVDSSVERNVGIVTFTYNEPTVYVEYLTDVARAARRRGLRSAVVSCGFMTEQPLAEMCDVLDAIKIDLKGFDETFYERVCAAELEPVLKSIRQVAKSETHLEVVNLVVPTLNDSDRMLRDLADWMVSEVGPDVPLHFSRFHPAFKLRNLSPTPIATLERAREVAMSLGMRYVYVGNTPGHPGAHTYCPSCGTIVIERSGFFVGTVRLEDGRCGVCHTEIPGVWT